jgi:hypothetical protein
VDPREPEEVYAALSQGLQAHPNALPMIRREDLEYFSQERFRTRVHKIMNTISRAFSDVVEPLAADLSNDLQLSRSNL